MNENGKPWDARLACQLVYPFRHSGLTPNHLTTLRLMFGIASCLAFSLGSYSWTITGAFLFCISNFLDHTDGELARLTGNTSRSGHYYDLISDALVNILLFVGIGIGLTQTYLGFYAIPMGSLAGIAIAAIFHLRHEIEQRIGKAEARQPNIGVMEAEDILYLLPIVSLAKLLIPFLILASFGAPLFALWVLREYRILKSDN